MPATHGGRKIGGLRAIVPSLQLMFVRHLPGPPGVALRRRYWSKRLGSLGEGVRIDEGVTIVNPEQVFIGSDCWIGANVLIGAGPPSTEGREVIRRDNPGFDGEEGEVRIGDHAYLAKGCAINGHGGVDIGTNAVVAAGVKVLSTSHHYRGADSEPGRASAAPGMRREGSDLVDRQVLLVGAVVVGRESLLASHAIVLPGVTVGPAAWLGPGGVARRDLEAGKVYRTPDLIEVEAAHGTSRGRR